MLVSTCGLHPLPIFLNLQLKTVIYTQPVFQKSLSFTISLLLNQDKKNNAPIRTVATGKSLRKGCVIQSPHSFDSPAKAADKVSKGFLVEGLRFEYIASRCFFHKAERLYSIFDFEFCFKL